jgi:nicotinamide-nucleotide amidase
VSDETVMGEPAAIASDEPGDHTPSVEVVAIGTELLLGQIVDTNSSWIGEQLAAAGLNSHFQTKVGDNPTRIRSVLELALDRSDAVICCGGLGPTQDDLTREVMAEVMGVELELDEAVADRIRRMFASRGRTMPDNNLRQAMVPVGASVIAQQPGTAPGLICPIRTEVGSKVIYAVPGVPYEMKEMVTGTIIPDLVARSGRPAVIRSRVLRTWGMSESGLAEMLGPRIEELDGVGNPTLAFLASGVEGLKVRITARANDETAALAVLDAEERLLRSLMGDIVFATDGDNMETVVVAALARRGLTIAVAESVTGGYVAGRLCAVAGASEVFRGGVVAYHPEIKRDLLGVPDGPVVTEAAATAMAQGVRAGLGADIGIATTGVAGPDEAEGRPVGTVCAAIAGLDVAGISRDVAVTMQLPGDRERIRQFATISLLDLLRKRLR